MKLEMFDVVQKQLELQYKQLIENPPPDGKEVIKWTNAIELCAAISLCKQLIIKEKQELAQPPGATGPVL